MVEKIEGMKVPKRLCEGRRMHVGRKINKTFIQKNTKRKVLNGCDEWKERVT